MACITSPTSPGVLPASFLASALAAFVLCEQHRVGPMSPLTCTVHVARNRSRRLYTATNGPLVPAGHDELEDMTVDWTRLGLDL